MFRSRRSTLLKRLWKFRSAQHESLGAHETESGDDLEAKSVAHSMLKRLKESQLDVLVHALETRGGETTECVLLPKGELKLGRRMVAPHVLCCQLFRWPGMVKSDTQMKRLSCCATLETDPAYICCNPHHWSLLLDPEFPPITELDSLDSDGLPLQRVQKCSGGQLVQQTVSTETGLTPTHYQQYSDDDLSSLYSPGSPTQENGGEGGGGEDREGGGGDSHHHQPPLPSPLTSHHPHHHWCSIAYWEMRERVGRLYVVREPSLSVFQRLPHGSGMCLELLQSDSQVDAVRKTREKIGLGLILSKEGRSVWAYNRSQFPLFVNSPTLEEPNCKSLVVWKVLPGYSVRLFDFDRLRALQRTREPGLSDGPYDPLSVRVSFAKGWGPCYSRQFVTSCPCWLEILLKEKR
ncbi:mothers against decapentaplegic homolog 6-like [Littorina saxatilis]|uniref:mothers against decapentaplegic homolog 6-like n=1 Tax=Littorina saxatilis TaxID=31220 RepID=UPI0038B471F6